MLENTKFPVSKVVYVTFGVAEDSLDYLDAKLSDFISLVQGDAKSIKDMCTIIEKGAYTEKQCAAFRDYMQVCTNCIEGTDIENTNKVSLFSVEYVSDEEVSCELRFSFAPLFEGCLSGLDEDNLILKYLKDVFDIRMLQVFDVSFSWCESQC